MDNTTVTANVGEAKTVDAGEAEIVNAGEAKPNCAGPIKVIFYEQGINYKANYVVMHTPGGYCDIVMDLEFIYAINGKKRRSRGRYQAYGTSLEGVLRQVKHEACRNIKKHHLNDEEAIQPVLDMLDKICSQMEKKVLKEVERKIA